MLCICSKLLISYGGLSCSWSAHDPIIIQIERESFPFRSRRLDPGTHPPSHAPHPPPIYPSHDFIRSLGFLQHHPTLLLFLAIASNLPCCLTYLLPPSHIAVTARNPDPESDSSSTPRRSKGNHFRWIHLPHAAPTREPDREKAQHMAISII